MPTEPCPYQFPTEADAKDWGAKVNDALATGRLAWVHVRDEIWTLAGVCPRCGDKMDQDFEFGGVILPDTFGGMEFKGPRSSTYPLEIVCNCGEQHDPDVRGCGFGKDLKVPVSLPR